MARSTRSKLEMSGSIQKYMLPAYKRNMNMKWKNVINEKTTHAFTTAIEAIEKQGDKRKYNIRLEVCPIKGKNCSLEAWLSEVELWNSSNNIGDPAVLNTKKYLALMESIRKAEDEELEKVAEVEFVENK